MKRGWIAVVMIALSLMCGGFEYIYVTGNADVYAGMLDEADDKMEHSLIKEAESVVRRLDHRFKSESGVLNMFMNHSGADNISSDLAMLCRYAQTGDTEEFLAASARAKREILTLRESKDLSWSNIF